jgi:lipoprotein signal peptidase
MLPLSNNRFLLFVFCFLTLDWVSKAFIYAFGPPIAVHDLLIDLSTASFITPAFHLLLPFEQMQLMMSVIALFFVSVVTLYAERPLLKDLFLNPFVAAILGGSFGNGIEGIYFSKVLDFFLVQGFEQYAIFNLADVLIGVGLVGLFLNLIYIMFSSMMKNRRGVRA